MPAPLFVPECPSTNDAVWAALDAGQMGHGQLLYTHYQTAGRGQRGTGWHADKGQNLLCSTLIESKGWATPATLFDVSRAVALASVAAIKGWTNGLVQPTIKWPNDLITDGCKLGGILIENRWSGPEPEWAVVGLGLNVNQTLFATNLPATSLKLCTGSTFTLQEGAYLVQEHIGASLARYTSGLALQQMYDSCLMGYQKQGVFKEPDAEPFTGRLMGTTPAGLLLIETQKGVKTYDLKEIIQIYS